MNIKIFDNKVALGQAAAMQAAQAIRQAVATRDHARIIAATGASQFEFLAALTQTPNLDWTRVEMFHLDEYVGMSIAHPASFRKYLLERFIQPTGITNYHLLDGAGDLEAACAQANAVISAAPIDIAFVGIGENGHLAFNDPPADFDVETPYILVNLDEACRQQQFGEGWFPTFADVPQQAISMSIQQILKAREIVCVVPDARKAQAVKVCLEGEISPMAPASILRTHPNATVYLDSASAALLSQD
jgi:glucosamine-6-phosphate deaminase